MFFISCSIEHGREDCPLRVRTCGPFPEAFFGHWKRGPWGELEEELLHYQETDPEVDARSAELCSKHPDIPKLVVIDETTQCENCKEHKAKKETLFCTCGVSFAGRISRKTRTLKETTAQVMIRLSCFCSVESGQEVCQGISVKKVKTTKSRGIISGGH